MHNEIILTTEIGLIILLAASAVAIITNRFNIPYTIGLVFAGLILSFYSIPQEARLTKDIIFGIFLPILLFEAAFHLPARLLRKAYAEIASLAIIGVLGSFFIVGILTHYAIDLPWEAAFLFAALIAATDPVSVVAFFKRVRTSRTLTTIVEGESLFNDGTAAVIFIITLSYLDAQNTDFLVFGISKFLVLCIGGGIVGVILGYIFSKIMATIDDYLVEITLSVILAYGSFILADFLGFSGIISVVVAGLMLGNLGQNIGMSATTRVTMVTFWDFAAFIVNSIIFIMIGLEILANNVLALIPTIFIVFVITLIARAITVYGISFGFHFTSRKIPINWQHVLFLGGLRGTIALALALSVPTNFPYREVIVTLTFGVVLMSLIGQGFLIEPLVVRLGLIKSTKTSKMIEKEGARLQGVVEAKRKLHELHQAKLVSEIDFLQLIGSLNEKEALLHNIHDSLVKNETTTIAESIIKTKRRLLYAERDTIQNLLKRNKIGNETAKELLEEIDHEIGSLKH